MKDPLNEAPGMHLDRDEHLNDAANRDDFTPSMLLMRDAYCLSRARAENGNNPAVTGEQHSRFHAEFQRGIRAHNAQVRVTALESVRDSWPAVTRDMVSRGFVRNWLENCVTKARGGHV